MFGAPFVKSPTDPHCREERPSAPDLQHFLNTICNGNRYENLADCAALSSAIQLTGNITFIGPATAPMGNIVIFTNSIIDIRDDYAVISNQGTITGPRYWANVGSIISSHNKGAYVFPGTSDGILQTGAAYY